MTSQTLYFCVHFEVLITRFNKMVSHMVEESHVHFEDIVDLSCDHVKVLLIVDMDMCTL